MILPDVNILVAAYRDDISDIDNTPKSPQPAPAEADE